MEDSFKAGYISSYIFYILECIVVVAIELVYHRLSDYAFWAFVVFAVVSIIVLYRGRKKWVMPRNVHMVAQFMLFYSVATFLCIVFHSAQVFIYALSFSSVLVFIFFNIGLLKFQLVMSIVMIVACGGIVATFFPSRETMLEYTFGSIMLVVMNWIILVVTNTIVFQRRQGREQERSLDYLLKVVEVKCDEARDATRSKTKFLANMSHEIRTPMSAVMGMNEMILRESNEQNIRNYAVETKIAAQSLMQIINDILDITKIEAGKLDMVPVDFSLPELIRDVYTLTRFRAEGKNLKFNLIVDESLPTGLVADDIKLKQILINLLSNAVKYTKEGSVSLEIKNTNAGIVFRVSDTGIGIAEDDLGNLCGAFERFDLQHNRSVQGTGLGLNITAGLLVMFGSELKVESEYGKGSTFYFTLAPEISDRNPIGRFDVNGREYIYSPYAAALEAPEARILVVDDNEVNRTVFKNLLKGTKAQIDEADSGAESIRMTKAVKYDIIFMDHMMPEMSGLEARELISSDKENLNCDTPIVALTANAISGAKEFYLQHGFVSFLSKPIEPAMLDNIIISLLTPELIRQGTASEKKSLKLPELPVIDGIDWSYASLHFNDVDMMMDTVRLFRTSIKKDTEELDGYFADIDEEYALDSYRIKVHSMKNSASLIGVVQLTGMAMELEKAARNGNVEHIKSMHRIFIDRWLTYYDMLQPLVGAEQTGKRAEDFRRDIMEIFVAIREAAVEMDVDTLDEMSKKLDEYSFTPEALECVEKIQGMILDFEVEKLSEYDYGAVLA